MCDGRGYMGWVGIEVGRYGVGYYRDMGLGNIGSG